MLSTNAFTGVRMLDRLISASLNLTVTSVISIATMASLVMGYWGLVQLLNDGSLIGGIALAAAFVPAAIACKAAIYRNDLIDR